MAAKMLDASPDIQALTSYCKATADNQRLTILRVLARESFGVLELCHILDTAQPALSHHLKVLSQSQLVETRRQGTSIFYRRALVPLTDPLRELRQSLFEAIDHTPLPGELTNRINEVHENRHQQAKKFFQKNSDRFQEDQNLIAEYVQYASSVLDILDNETLANDATVVEIGPGNSDLLLNLAERFQHIVAIDNTEEMLEKARRNIADTGRTDVEFLRGELKDYGALCDLLVLNMVLHHLAAPARFFQEARRHLKDNGLLLIVDLCPHDQHWTREACGDLWPGFDPEELDSWAGAAGFTNGQSAYLGLKNGFQVQVQTYH